MHLGLLVPDSLAFGDTMNINLELDGAEAIFLQGKLSVLAAEAQKVRAQMADAPTVERESAEIAATILSRILDRLTNLVYARCDYIWDLPECDRSPAPGQTTCQFHLDRLAGKVPVFSA